MRDLLHVADLIELIDLQLGDPQRWDGFVGNVGGGREFSLSLAETTALCRELTGNEVAIGAEQTDRPGDVPLYLSDCSRLYGQHRLAPAPRPEPGARRHARLAARERGRRRRLAGARTMKLSVVIPAHNEAGSIAATLRETAIELEQAGIEHEILVVDDASSDGTPAVVAAIAAEHPGVRCMRSHHPRGFGFTVRSGLERFQGDAVAVMMADGSDDAQPTWSATTPCSRTATTAPSARASSSAARSTTTRG